MSMPWDNEPRRPTPPPQPPYVPPQQPYVPPPAPRPTPPQQMQPDVPPIVARNPQTGETVRVDIGADLREAIRQAITGAVVENKDIMQANANKAIAKMVKAEVKEEVDEKTEQLEESFSGGPATTRTFIQGAALDIGAAVFAVLATAIGPDSNLFDKEMWGIVGVMMLKTLVQTGLSYMMRFQAK